MPNNPRHSQAAIAEFRNAVWQYFARHRRTMPWREPESNGTFDPYKIFVSELMLQQTQVSRVEPKFLAFVATFPDVHALAQSELADVLRLWQGLGYNRRAKYLWQAAQMVVNDFGGIFPRTMAELSQLPGVGPGTAGAVAAYAYNEPVVFIETNLRSVFIHHFFANVTGVSDADLRPLVQAALPPKKAREWYWALMDYGTFLKSTNGNAARRSKHYARQSAFAGSRRQVRGAILRALGEGPLSLRELQKTVADNRVEGVLQELQKEGLIHFKDNQFVLG